MGTVSTVPITSLGLKLTDKNTKQPTLTVLSIGRRETP